MDTPISSRTVEERKRGLEFLLAAGNGDSGKVEQLLGEENDVLHVTDSDGNTALHWAAEGGEIKVWNFLLERSDLPMLLVENNKNKTALDVASRVGCGKCSGGCSNQMLDEIEKRLLEGAKQLSDNYKIKTEPVSTGQGQETVPSTSRASFTIEDTECILKFFCQPFPLQKPPRRNMETVIFTLPEKCEISLQCVKDKKETYYLFRTAPDQTEGETNDEPIRVTVNDIDEALINVVLICKFQAGSNEQGKKQADYRKDLTNIAQSKHESTSQNMQEYRPFFAAVLEEIGRTRAKVSKCCQFLGSIKEEGSEFSYKVATTLVLCFETFAAQDTFLKVQLETKVLEQQLKQAKKGFLKRNFPAETDVFGKWRNYLVKTNGNCIITKDVFQRAIGDENVTQLLTDFHYFAAYVKERMGAESEKDTEREEFNPEGFYKLLDSSAEKFKSGRDKIASSAVNGDEILRHFSKRAAEFIEGNQDDQDAMYEALFHLLVNMQEQVNSRHLPLEKPRKLRNIIIHDFQNQTSDLIREELPAFIMQLHRRELAVKINSILDILRDEKDCTEIEEEFRKALDKVNGMFPELPIEETADLSFDEWKEDKVNLYLKTYINHLAPLLDISADNDDDIMSTPTVHSGKQIQQMCAQFITLDQLYTNKNSEGLETKKGKVQRVLQDKFKVDKEEAWHATEETKFKIEKDEACCATEETNVSGCSENKELENYVGPLIKHLLNVVKPEDISYSSLLSLIKRKIQPKTGIEAIDNVLQYLPAKNQETEIKYGHEKRTVSVRSVVHNLLSMFLQARETGRIKIESIASAFRDELFLEYLLRLQTTMIPNRVTNKYNYQLNEPFKTYKIIRDVREITYTAPYVAMLLTRTANMKVIDYESTKDLIMTLSRNMEGLAIENLLRAQSDSLNPVIRAVSEIVLDVNLPEQRLQVLLKSVCGAERLSVLVEMMDTVQKSAAIKAERMGKFLSTANDVIHGFLDENYLQSASALIECADKVENNLFDEQHQESSLDVQRNLLKAKLFNAQGVEMSKLSVECEKKESNQLKEMACMKFRRSIGILKEIQSASEGGVRMLAMAREAYTYYLLGKQMYTLADAEKAHECAKKLLKEMWQYITNDDDEPPTSYQSYLRRALESPRYQSLLNQDVEYAKYLSVHKLKSTSMFYRFPLVKKDYEKCSAQLVMYDELYTVSKKYTLDGTSRPVIRSFSVLKRIISLHYRSRKMNNIGECKKRHHTLKWLEMTIIMCGRPISWGVFEDVDNITKFLLEKAENDDALDRNLVPPSSSETNWRVQGTQDADSITRLGHGVGPAESKRVPASESAGSRGDDSRWEKVMSVKAKKNKKKHKKSGRVGE